MSVLVYVEASEGKFKKAAFEAVSYGAKVAALLKVETHALCAFQGIINIKFGSI